MWKQCGPRNHLWRRISKPWFAAKLLFDLFGKLSQDTPAVHVHALQALFSWSWGCAGTLTCTGTRHTDLDRNQVHSPAQEPGTPSCCCSSGEYNIQNQIWGGFRTISSEHSLKHPPNTAMNSSTDLMVKIILCISSVFFFFLCSFIHLIYHTYLLSAPVIPVDFPTMGCGRAIRGVSMFCFSSTSHWLGTWTQKSPAHHLFHQGVWQCFIPECSQEKKKSRFSPQPEFPGPFCKSFLEKELLRIKMLWLKAG